MKKYFLLIVAANFINISHSQTVTTFAGSTAGYIDGTGTNSQFYNPNGLCVDSMGNIFVADESNHKIRKISSDGVVSTFAGSTSGFMDGIGTNAKFLGPSGVCVDNADNIYVADRYNHKIRKITPTGVVSTVAGSSQGFLNGSPTVAKFNFPSALCVDNLGNIFVADRDNHRIRKISSSGAVTTFAGSTQGYLDGISISAKFNRPLGICLDPSGNIFIADIENEGIRKITSDGTVSTFAGTIYGFNDGNGINAQFHRPLGICSDSSGNLYVSQISNIRKITPPADVTTIAGDTGNGSGDGDALTAQFNTPGGIAIDGGGNILVADTANHRIRKITGLLSVGQFGNTDLSFKIYPNPATESLNIQAENIISSSQVKITDVMGKVIFTRYIDDYSTLIDVSNYQKGLYLVTIYDTNRKYIKKCIIQ